MTIRSNDGFGPLRGYDDERYVTALADSLRKWVLFIGFRRIYANYPTDLTSQRTIQSISISPDALLWALFASKYSSSHICSYMCAYM